MEFTRIYKTIERIAAWIQTGRSMSNGENKEILKPLNRLIDFEKKELIFENNHLF